MDSIPQTDGARLKRCSACKLDKPLSEFHHHRGHPDGYHYSCKPCIRVEHQARIKHPFTPRYPQVMQTCAQCGAEFKVRRVVVQKGEGRYCSYSCAYAGRTRSLAERFWSHVDITGGPDACWPWTARRTKYGHGVVNRGLDGRGHAASRVAWELTHDPIPDGLLVCHRCPGGDNPACCNPAHLYLGTSSDNNTDTYQRGGKAQKST